MKQQRTEECNIRLPELLAPAGSFIHLEAAVKAGADAIYAGGQQFGARAYADNFTKEKLVEALHYVHFHGRRLYLTVNTLVKEQELADRLGEYLQPLYEEGLDGVIVQDIGAAAFIYRQFPGMEIHGSTQMTITDVYGARAAARLGMNRVVPARELSLRELTRIKEETGLEIEVFVHGALCYCYSGQCLLSSLYGGRSGNRGRCAQPCRLPYQLCGMDGRILSGKEHLLSPKDLCAISLLPALIQAGMDSLKIEGRMKNVEYVAGVTAIYRKYLDAYRRRAEKGTTAAWKVEKQDYETLEELYSRSGFTDGYWERHNGAVMMSTVHPRNLGRNIGQVRQVRGGQIAARIEKDVILHPKDILILPLKDGEELVLTVPEKLTKENTLTIFNVPKTRGLRAGMEIYRRKNADVSAWIQNDILKKEIKYPVKGEIMIEAGQPVTLRLRHQDTEVCLSGQVAQTSQKRPLTAEDIHRQMHKTGEVPFYLEELKLHLGENVFLPMSAVKELRRQGFARLEEQLKINGRRISDCDRKISLQSARKSDTVIPLNNNTFLKKKQKKQSRKAVVCDRQLLAYCLSEPFFDAICLPMDFWQREELLPLAEEIVGCGKQAFLFLPQILRFGDRIPEQWETLCRSPLWSGIYANNIGQAQFLHELKGRTAPIYAAASLYQWNHLSLEKTRELFSLAGAQLPVELSGAECGQLLDAWEQSAKLEIEAQVYGHIPVMRSAQCVKKTKGLCNHRQETQFLQDKKGRRLPVVSHCDGCYTTIWSEKAGSLAGERYGERIAALDAVTFHFFLATKEDAKKAVREYMRWEQNGYRPTKAGTPDAGSPDRYWNDGIE